MSIVVVDSAAAAPAAADIKGFDFIVDSEMGPVNTRVYRAADGNKTRVAYALHGMESEVGVNGWESGTDAAETLAAANVNVVLPIGGRTSFWTDWKAPSTPGLDCFAAFLPQINDSPHVGSSSGSADELKQRQAYKWETFLTRDLPTALHDRLGFQRVRNAIFGVSMGGGAALTLAAYHPGQFSFVGSFSGFPNISAPLMPEAIRLAVLVKSGLNIDCMWGPPWNPMWRRNDPFVSAPRLKAAHTRVYIGSGTGIPTAEDLSNPPGTAVDLGIGLGLEALAFANSKAFELRLHELDYDNVTYDFWPQGIHSWPHWRTHVKPMIADLITHVG
ncbi:alpha/beta hydrolase family protein [Nocardia sp. JMUB6875]|uniref:alpha/beta hydrolase n=1 Tax=Nocardia sp. JMUB6875 TaxID=3158170 RepID=UPI0032E66C79